MLYGFGDDRNPYTESVDFLEDLVMKFITDTTKKVGIKTIDSKCITNSAPRFRPWKLDELAGYKLKTSSSWSGRIQRCTPESESC